MDEDIVPEDDLSFGHPAIQFLEGKAPLRFVRLLDAIGIAQYMPLSNPDVVANDHGAFTAMKEVAIAPRLSDPFGVQAWARRQTGHSFKMILIPSWRCFDSFRVMHANDVGSARSQQVLCMT
jgi:hypothetical protein